MYPVTLLLALALPFEAIRPLVLTPWAALTDEKVILILAAVAWVMLGAGALPTPGEWRSLLPSLALLLVSLVAAIQAPDFGDESLKFVWRLAAGAFALLLATRLGRDDAKIVVLLWAIVVGAGVSTLLGLGEAIGWHTLDPLLSQFKVAPTHVGGELRVGASFQYATIAAMYFEMAAPLAIVLSAVAQHRWTRLLGLTVAALCTANVVLSLTRAGMLTLAVVFAILLAIAWLDRLARARLLAPTLLSTTVLVGGVAILAVRDPVFDMRLITESDADWYGAAYEAPALLQVESDRSTTIGLDVRNEGRIIWLQSGTHPFALGYRWLTADGTGVLDIPPGEVPLSHNVAPGETIHLETTLPVPNLPAGSYRLDWGMLQRDVLQFYERGWADAETLVQVDTDTVSQSGIMPAISPRDDGEAPWVFGRLDLWGAALRLIETRPWLGYGPDSFRHLYGAQLGLETWDKRVQANNLFLEILVDLGVVGLIALLWVIVPPLVRAARAIVKPTRQRETGQRNLLVVGLGLGVLAFVVHGVLDSFLAFTPHGPVVLDAAGDDSGSETAGFWPLIGE